MFSSAPVPTPRGFVRLAAVVALGAAVLSAAPARASTSGASCAKSVAVSLDACVSTANNATRKCYLAKGAACHPDNKKIQTALNRLSARVLANCPDPTTLAAAGYGPLVTPQTLIDKLQNDCTGEAATLAARTFGGPKGLVLSRGTQFERACLEKAHIEATSLISQAMSIEAPCVQAPLSGNVCDVAGSKGQVSIKEVNAATNIASKCTDLEQLIGTDIQTYVSRTTDQVHCAVASALGSTGALEEACGPRTGVPVLARGKKKRITLAPSTGALCGNGSRYAFWIRLAPEGQPADRVVVLLQNGGICTDEASCSAALARAPLSFEARRDRFNKKGLLSNDPAENPFADWTKVFLPNCSQDAFTGGGVANDLGGITVQRYGAQNVRAALQRVRDIVWSDLDATSANGYRPDLLQVVFGGSGGGGYGVAFNLHYLLDELRWTHTTAVVDSSIAPDNGADTGIATTFPPLLLGGVEPAVWGSRSVAPPYALPDNLVTGPDLITAHAARLDVGQGQLLLNVSNQVDNAQVSFGNFTGQAPFVNAVRSAYCETRNDNGLHFFLPASPTSASGFLNTGLLATTSSAGTTLTSWLGSAVASPATLTDKVEEASLVAQLGVQPFDCLP